MLSVFKLILADNIVLFTSTIPVSVICSASNVKSGEMYVSSANLNSNDLIFVFSVGGGNYEKNVSANLVEALKYGKSIGSKLIGIVGRDGGYTSKVADECVIIPIVNEKTVTPHTEAFQAVLWHLIVSHPKLKLNETKWESMLKK